MIKYLKPCVFCHLPFTDDGIAHAHCVAKWFRKEFGSDYTCDDYANDHVVVL